MAADANENAEVRVIETCRRRRLQRGQKRRSAHSAPASRVLTYIDVTIIHGRKLFSVLLPVLTLIYQRERERQTERERACVCVCAGANVVVVPFKRGNQARHRERLRDGNSIYRNPTFTDLNF